LLISRNGTGEISKPLAEQNPTPAAIEQTAVKLPYNNPTYG
jgi:hypothetical protein